MNSLGKYVLTKTQKIVLLVVVFALIAGGYYAGFYLPVQRRIEAADTAELDAQIQLEQMKAMQIWSFCGISTGPRERRFSLFPMI